MTFVLPKPSKGTTNYHPNILYTPTVQHHRFDLPPKSLLTSLQKSWFVLSTDVGSKITSPPTIHHSQTHSYSHHQTKTNSYLHMTIVSRLVSASERLLHSQDSNRECSKRGQRHAKHTSATVPTLPSQASSCNWSSSTVARLPLLPQVTQ
jgi:hypothetical protein